MKAARGLFLVGQITVESMATEVQRVHYRSMKEENERCPKRGKSYDFAVINLDIFENGNRNYR